jgi:Zn-dependent peptidase ImmA (M78 family)/transcriptional regulator with XRE-family HTH domain
MTSLSDIFGGDVDSLSPEEAARRSKTLFVRGRVQLAEYEEGSGATGQIISAWEAYQAYGLEKLEEVVDYGSAILLTAPHSSANAVQRRREALGLKRSVSRRLGVSMQELEELESGSRDLPAAVVERVGFNLGLDENQIGFRRADKPDAAISTRLKTLQAESPGAGLRALSANAVLVFAEAASITRVQNGLRSWLGLPSTPGEFEPSKNYGGPDNPAWNVGYLLAMQARQKLGLGCGPITSMRELLEETLGVPVIQASLPVRVAGAAVATTHHDGEHRGIVLNTAGPNENPLVRRATLAHELGHLLFDPPSELESVRVDSYRTLDSNPYEMVDSYYVEQRANAFAIAFLAPLDAVRAAAPPPIGLEDIALVMERFGISYTAAKFHVHNAHHRNEDVPEDASSPSPSESWRGAEDYALDYFPIKSTPPQRRGSFAGLVAESAARGLISIHSAAKYLLCAGDEAASGLDAIRGLCLYPIPASQRI